MTFKYQRLGEPVLRLRNSGSEISVRVFLMVIHVYLGLVRLGGEGLAAAAGGDPEEPEELKLKLPEIQFQ